MSAGNDIYVKEDQGQTLLAQIEAEKNIEEQMTQRPQCWCGLILQDVSFSI
jgi:hypothetical protein